MFKWLIKHSKWIFNNKGQFDPIGFQRELQKQIGGLRQLAVSELQRRQKFQDELELAREKARIELEIKKQDPMQQLLERGQAAQAIGNIAELGGDISQFRGLFGQAPTQAPGVPTQVPTQRPEAPTQRPIGVEPTQEVVPTAFERTPFGEIRPTKFEDIVLKKQQQEQESKLKAKAEVFKLSEKGRANFGRAMGMFSTIVAQAKGMQEEQKKTLEKVGVKTTGLGLLPGLTGALAVKAKRPGFGRTAAFRGQRRETAISLNSILTGQNRVIRSVIGMIFETLPDPFDPEDIMATKLAQSTNNAYRLVKAFQKAGLTPETLQQMSAGELNDIDAKSLIALYTLNPNEQKEIDKIIKDILKTPAMPARRFGTFQGAEEFTPEQIEAEIRRRRLR
jgi:hypothetical protein